MGCTRQVPGTRYVPSLAIEKQSRVTCTLALPQEPSEPSKQATKH
jgi:hypothetical protein